MILKPPEDAPLTSLLLAGHGRDLGWSGIEASTEEKTVTIVL